MRNLQDADKPCQVPERFQCQRRGLHEASDGILGASLQRGLARSSLEFQKGDSSEQIASI